MKTLLFVLVSLFALAGVTSTSAIKTRNYCMTQEEFEVLFFINTHRAINGKDSLRPMQTLGAAAEHHSRSMANGDWFGHDFPDGTTWSQNITNHGYSHNTWTGENLAAGQTTSYEAFRAWRDSPGHNGNMLSDNYNAIGIGQAFNANSLYRTYWTTTFAGVYDPGVKYCIR